VTCKEFIASHTGRQFFDSFREFVGAFKTYVQQLTLQNQVVAEFQTEIDAVDANMPDSMPCAGCGEICLSSISVMLGWRGAVSLVCVKCAKEKGLIDADDTAN
jgi:hypothetical protein